jgi:hypothetical protein
MLPNNTLIQDRYRIIEQIGRGGMGAVYKAIDTRLRTTVALKQMLVEGEPLRRAFEREAQLLASLRHPTLPRVSDHFIDQYGQFLIMEFIPGDDLGALLQQNKQPFAVADVLRWADQLLDALDYLHTQTPPVIHRDIKPQNLKLTGRSEIILLDFGLAKGSSVQTRVTSSGSIFGYTPHYAPLEQIEGTGTDPRSDLYSLAATLYHLLTNKMPVDALARASAKINDEPDPLILASTVNPAVPLAVAAVLQQAMAQRATQRPPTATAMRSALREVGRETIVDAVAIKPISQAPNSVQTVAGAATVGSGAYADPAPSLSTRSPVAGTQAGQTARLEPQTAAPAVQDRARRSGWLWALLAVPVLLVLAAIAFFAVQRGGVESLFAGASAAPTSIVVAATAPAQDTPTPTESAAQRAQTQEALIQVAVNGTSVALASTSTVVSAQQTADVATAQAVVAEQTAAAGATAAAQQTADAATAQAVADQQAAATAAAQAAATAQQVAIQQTAAARPTAAPRPTRPPQPTRTPRPTAAPEPLGQCRISGGGTQLRSSCSTGAAIAGVQGSCITGSVLAKDGNPFQSFLVFVDTGGAPPEYRLERHNTATYSVCGLGAGTWGVAVAAANDIPYDPGEQGAHLVVLMASGTDGEHFIVNFREQP